MRPMQCLLCDERIDGDFRWINTQFGPKGLHRECAMRAVIGGLNHQLGLCLCCGGSEPPDPPHLTRREAAKAAVLH